jgi:hypothetical protein
VRYEVAARPDDAVICHCRMCQRASGGPAQAYARAPRAALRYAGAEPAVYRSSPDIERRFCPSCGGHLEYRSAGEPDHVWISLGTLDDPGLVRPGRHEHAAAAAPWDGFCDGLPVYLGERPSEAPADAPAEPEAGRVPAPA